MYARDNLIELLDKANYKNANLKDANVVVRSCLNVPLSKDGQITDRTRIDESLPLLMELKGQAKRVVIMAHLGRPEAKDSSLSLRPVKDVLEQEIGVTIEMLEEIDDVDMKESGFYLVENIRFFEGENSKDHDEQVAFAQKLAKLGDIFINDAFADYRESPSTYEIAKLIPSYIGASFYSEIKAFAAFKDAQKPFVAVLGGAKLSEKLDVLYSLGKDADKILVGGAMAYTLLKAMGHKVGKSLVEDDKLDVAEDIINKYSDKIVLPVDHVTVDEFVEPEDASQYTVINGVDIPDDKMGVDIGPKTVELFLSEIAKSKSIIWNGPMGVFEWDLAGKETEQIAKAIAAKKDAYKLAGGGDSIAAINKYNVQGFDHISTGGGAMLAYFAYDTFMTLDMLLDNQV